MVKKTSTSTAPSVRKKSSSANRTKKTSTKSAAVSTRVTPKRSAVKTISSVSLLTWNKWLALIHLMQGVAVLLLSTTATLPLTVSYLGLDPIRSIEGAPVLAAASRQIGDVNLAYLVAAFFFVSALAHALIAFVLQKRYLADLAQGINRMRWIEYSISASIMIVAIGMLVGVYDLSALLTLFGLTSVMNLLGLVMELHNKTTVKPSWASYIVGCIAGILPWVVIAIYLITGALYGATVPTFVYVIFVSTFIFFMSFALNMYLQYARKGKWKDYLYSERAYMILSLVAKSALAWQVFGGTLRP